MDTGFIAALDDDQVVDRRITTQPFSPPSLSTSQFKQLELLRHLSLYSELLILVCADKGMGKTFIAKALLASREIPDQSLMFVADFSLSYLDVLHKLAQFLDLAELADDIESIEQQVLAKCIDIAEEDRGSVLLIIDHADQLSDEVLGDINQLALLVPSALHIMMLAPIGFETKIFTLVDPQAPCHVMEVESLIDDEAEILLLEQYPEEEWVAEQVDYILQQSVGNPGKILYLAQQVLSGVEPQKKETVVAKFPITHIAAILLVASALIVSYFYQNNSSIDELNSDAVTVEVIPPFITEPLLANSSLSPSEEVPSAFIAEKIEEVEEIDFNFSKPVVELPKKPMAIEADLELEETVKKDLIIGEAVSEEREIFYSKDEAVLVSVDSSSFVIQLFGSYSSSSAQTFIRSNATKTIPLRSYQTQHQGRPWYVVIAGPFDSRVTATQQAKRLSIKLRQQKPWIRSILPIQASLKSRK